MREVQPAFELLEKARYMRKTKEKASLAALQFGLLVHVQRRGFKGCQAFALAEEKLLKRYIQKTYEKIICSAGWVSIVLPEKTKTSLRPSSSLTRRRLFQTFCRQVESEVVVKELVPALQLYWVLWETRNWAKRLDRSCGRASARSSTPR